VYFLEIGVLSPAEKMYPFEGEIIEKTAESQAWPVQVGNFYFPGQPLAPGDASQLEGILLLQIEI
jgi:hypothetical protein